MYAYRLSVETIPVVKFECMTTVSATNQFTYALLCANSILQSEIVKLTIKGNLKICTVVTFECLLHPLVGLEFLKLFIHQMNLNL